ncbi:Hypothetical predicted protein [Cloeon dipterum]|uniref:Uncharacterized protein n=1 Tax=Cloeon dipterum TaxID=197152 RepID=A0A8S1DUW6_9INSE|nr:Hypothetical predicted protein [Cloeon dipterum]
MLLYYVLTIWNILPCGIYYSFKNFENFQEKIAEIPGKILSDRGTVSAVGLVHFCVMENIDSEIRGSLFYAANEIQRQYQLLPSPEPTRGITRRKSIIMAGVRTKKMTPIDLQKESKLHPESPSSPESSDSQLVLESSPVESKHEAMNSPRPEESYDSPVEHKIPDPDFGEMEPTSFSSPECLDLDLEDPDSNCEAIDFDCDSREESQIGTIRLCSRSDTSEFEMLDHDFDLKTSNSSPPEGPDKSVSDRKTPDPEFDESHQLLPITCCYPESSDDLASECEFSETDSETCSYDQISQFVDEQRRKFEEMLDRIEKSKQERQEVGKPKRIKFSSPSHGTGSSSKKPLLVRNIPYKKRFSL